MAKLVLLNGAPGSGKSTLATRWAAEHPMTLALDVDVLKHMLGAWEADQQESGLQARVLALVVIWQHLRSGYDVIVPQFLARPEFADALTELAEERGADYLELLLDVDAGTLAARLAARAEAPDRPEQVVNSAFVSPEDAPALVDAVAKWAAERPVVTRIDASGSVEQALSDLRSTIG